jgi:XTP/dITP diphosphohydrolase
LTRLVVATANQGKLRELKAALADATIDVTGLDTLDDKTVVEETGSTFEENARLKAEQYSLRTPHAVLADDSGLEVDAMNGEPGVLSARYGGDSYDDKGRNQLVLDKMKGVPDAQRTARFRCVLALARGGRTIATFEGAVEGRLLHEQRGNNGFGYDAIFFHDVIGKGFGEITLEQKQALSHRGQAIRILLYALKSGALSLDPSLG